MTPVERFLQRQEVENYTLPRCPKCGSVRRYVFRMEDGPSDVFTIACPVCGPSVKNATFTHYDNPWRKENDI